MYFKIIFHCADSKTKTEQNFIYFFFYLVQINRSGFDIMVGHVVEQWVPRYLYLQHGGSAEPPHPLKLLGNHSEHGERL